MGPGDKRRDDVGEWRDASDLGTTNLDSDLTGL
jgi:hypothetical protein